MQLSPLKVALVQSRLPPSEVARKRHARRLLRGPLSAVTGNWASSMLKVHGPIFQNLVFHFISRIIITKMDVRSKFVLQLPISYSVSLIMVTISSHIFITVPNGTLFSCEICHRLWEKYELSCDINCQKVEKNWKDRTGLFKEWWKKINCWW